MQLILSSSSDRGKIFYLFLFLFAGLYLGAGLSELFVGWLAPDGEPNIWTIRVNVLVQAVFMFLLPACTLVLWSYPNFFEAMRLVRSRRLMLGIVFGILIFVAIYPFTSFLTQWNKSLQLPQWLSTVEQWMQQGEDAASKSVDMLMSDLSIIGILLNIFILTVVAAFAEEFFFRGVLQQLLKNVLGSYHAAIWLTALIFSAIHFQFYGFLPRMVLGAMLGYLFYLTNNIWVPIFIHFLNNFIIVIIMSMRGVKPELVQALENQPLSLSYLLLAIASGAITIALFYIYRKKMSGA